MSHRFARNGGAASVEYAAATLTASATPHTNGAYTQLIASTDFDVCGVMLRCTTLVGAAGVDTSMLATLAVGAAASEVDVVTHIACGGVAGGAGGRIGHFPIHIPAGSRVAGKLRAEVVSDTLPLEIIFLYGGRMPGWGGYSVCDTYGADTANSRGTPISNTPGTYTEITASTTAPIRAFNISAGLVDNTVTLLTHTVDVGIGGAGSEVVLGTWVYVTDSSENVFLTSGPSFLENPIPTGSRLAVKKDTADDLSVVIHGWR